MNQQLTCVIIQSQSSHSPYMDNQSINPSPIFEKLLRGEEQRVVVRRFAADKPVVPPAFASVKPRTPHPNQAETARMRPW